MKNKNALKYLYDVSGKTKWSVVLLTVLQGVLGIASVFYALLLRDIINFAVEGNSSGFFVSTAVFALLICVQLALRYFCRYLDEYTRSRLENRFKSRLFSSILHTSYSYVSSVHSGDWMNRLTNDTVVTANGITDILPGVFGMAVKLLGAVVMIIIIEPRSAFLLLPGGILIVLTSYLFRKRIKTLHKQVQEKDGRLRMFLQDVLGSMSVVRAYAAEDDTAAAADEKMSEHRGSRLKKNRFSNFCNLGFGLIMNGAYFIAAIYCGYGILTGSMSYGTFTAVLQLIGQIQAPFANISGYVPRYYAMLASAERLLSVEASEQDEKQTPKPLEEILGIYNDSLESIGLREVWFTYPPPVAEQGDSNEMPPVLCNIDLTIGRGELVAFTGHSGCGKSTVLKLLMGLYEPDSGERYMIIRNSLKRLDREYQRLFAYVPQGNHLMSGTVREIVSFASPKHANDDEKIRHSLRVACAEQFVDKLNDGADTLLGERGQGLSEGQMQRLAIARAVFSDRPILMLDEATSALDSETEERLLRNLRSMTDKTVIIVTHRPAALKICDRIVDFSVYSA